MDIKISSQMTPVSTTSVNAQKPQATKSDFREMVDHAVQSLEAETQPTQDIDQAVSDINSAIQNTHHNVVFTVDEDTGRDIVKVVDRETEQTIRQIPAEEVLEMVENLESVRGMIFRERA